MLRLQVDDVEAVVAGATAAGARVVTGPTALPQGVLAARVADPWGGVWWLEQQTGPVEVDELLGRLGDPAVLATVTAYDAALDAELRGRS